VKQFDIRENEDADMIVMATHWRTGLSHALMGSVAEKVVRQVPAQS
jgi:nucleotide-binding universal stress UspA family protein